MVGFIRFGNDFTQNFYQIEIPLKVTVPSASSTSDCSPLSAQEVWPRKRNRFVISIIDSIENNGNECRFKHL
jgi:cell surface protein SprA